MKAESLVDALPRYEKPRENLAVLLVEILFWDEMAAQISVWIHLSSCSFRGSLTKVLGEEFVGQVYSQLEEQVTHRLNARSLALLVDHLIDLKDAGSN